MGSFSVFSFLQAVDVAEAIDFLLVTDLVFTLVGEFVVHMVQICTQFASFIRFYLTVSCRSIDF